MRVRSVFSSLLFFVVLAAACSNQQEGDRCDTRADNNGNDDCRNGLICYPANQLNGSPNSDRCCPADRSQATVDVCRLPQAVIGTDAGGGGDSAAPDASSDAPNESSADASVDVNGDAPGDATGDSPADALDSGDSGG